jgi:hypothetical protein
MAVGTPKIYEKTGLLILNQGLDFVNDTIKAALLDTSHTVDLVNHDFFDDVSADECADGDYVQQTLASKTLATVSGKARFDFADIDFGNAVTISARYLVIFKDTGVEATSPLIWVVDLNTGGGNLSSTNSDFDVAVNANGIYEITYNV